VKIRKRIKGSISSSLIRKSFAVFGDYPAIPFSIEEDEKESEFAIFSGIDL
jgi:hypothetical protein